MFARRKGWLVLAVLLAAALLVMAGCSSQDAPEEPADPDEPGSDVVRIAMLLPGPINDGSWNTAAYNGLMELARAGGYETDFMERIHVEDIEEAFYNYAELGYDLVIGHGFEFGEPAIRVAQVFPNTNFYISGKPPSEGIALPANTAFLDQMEWEGWYLCGVIAGLMTETNRIGYVGGMEIPTQVANKNAFEAGARSVNPDIQFYGILTGTYEDPALGKETAEAILDAGADIVAQAADSTGIGAIEACVERGAYTFGYSLDQSSVAPGLVLTSMLVDIPSAIEGQGEKIKAGAFESGVWRAGLASGVISLADYDSAVPQDVIDTVEEIKRDIISGRVVVPEIYE